MYLSSLRGGGTTEHTWPPFRATPLDTTLWASHHVTMSYYSLSPSHPFGIPFRKPSPGVYFLEPCLSFTLSFNSDSLFTKELSPYHANCAAGTNHSYPRASEIPLLVLVTVFLGSSIYSCVFTIVNRNSA